MFRATYLVFLLTYLSHVMCDCGQPFEEIIRWKKLEFDYKSELQQEDIDAGFYIPRNVAPLDLAIHYKNGQRRIFLTIPRFIKGSPITLGTVTSERRNGNRVIAPYPSLEWHHNPLACKRNRLVSVFRVAIDRCNRLWVLDSGQYDSMLTCPPQIVIFDLSTDKVIRQFNIPPRLYNSGTYYATPIVDVRGRCGNAFMYAADPQSFTLLVYSFQTNRAWSAKDRTMYPDPYWGYTSYKGEKLHLMDGILGMALEPYEVGVDRKLFYSSLSGDKLNWVNTSSLRQESLFRNDPESSPGIFHTYLSTRGDTSAAQAIDSNGISYFGSLKGSAILCWNIKSSKYGEFIDTVYQNDVTMDFASGVKVVKNTQGKEYLWVLTSRYYKALLKTYNNKEVNFRISRLPVDRVLMKTKCGNPNRQSDKKCGKYVKQSCKSCGYSLNKL